MVIILLYTELNVVMMLHDILPEIGQIKHV